MKPAVVVDKIIEIALDLLVPGRGAGESNWYVFGALLQSTLLYCYCNVRLGYFQRPRVFANKID